MSKGNFVKGEELEDSYPVYYGYTYYSDGEVVRSGIEGDIFDLKMELRRCGKRAEQIFTAELI